MDNALVHAIVLWTITFTCLAVFVATAIAVVLDLFNLIRLAADIRKKLHVLLLIETVGTCVMAFSGVVLTPAAIAAKEAQRNKIGFAVAANLAQAVARGGAGGTAPQTSQSMQEIELAAEEARVMMLAGARVLWVDDNPQNQLFERKALEPLGLHFSLAKNTEQALVLMQRTSFDLIITDFAREDDPMGGYTLLGSIKKKSNAPPVIIYSGHTNEQQREDAIRRGAFGQTNRPQELFGMVTEALRKRRVGF